MKAALERWQQWGKESASHRIFSAAVTIFSVTALVKVVGAAKVVLVARYYGTGSALDAYLVAFLIPSFFGDVVAGAIASAFIPSLVDVQEHEGRGAAQRLLRNIAGYCTFICLMLTAIMLAASGPLVSIVGSGFSAEKLALTRSLLLVLSPIVLMGGIGAVWRAALNTMEQFAVPAAAPAITPLTTIAAVVLTAAIGRRPDAFTLAWGTAAGSCLESGLIGWRLGRCGYFPLPWWSAADKATKRVIQQYWPIMLSSLVFGATVYVDQSMAAMLGSGSVSALNYGTRLLSVALAAGPGALGTAALPQFSAMVARQEWGGLRKTLGEYRRKVLVLAVPLTLVLVAASGPLVRVAFQRGAFTAEDAKVVVGVQQFALLQVPAAILSAMLARLVSSMRENRKLLLGAAVSLGVNIVLNYVLMQWFGVAGIALATSVAAYIYYCYLERVLFRMEGAHHR